MFLDTQYKSMKEVLEKEDDKVIKKHMSRLNKYVIPVKLSVVPFNDKTHTPRGVFSTRTPMHPNSLGLSVVELIKVEGNIVTIKGVDILDGTPLLDIKPYIENFDKVEGKVKSGWMKSSVSEKKSDDRFVGK